MKTVLLMRHAKSSWNDSSLADHDRPLNKRGKQDAPLMGRWLGDQQELFPDQIVSSTARRALETAVAMAEALHYERSIDFQRDLYHADAEEYLAYLRGLPAAVNCVLIVGHNPGMEELVAHLSGVEERMPTAAVAYFTLSIADWSEVDDSTVGSLLALWRPKELPR